MVNIVDVIGETLLRSAIVYVGIFAGFLFVQTPLRKYQKGFSQFTINWITPIIGFLAIIMSTLDEEWFIPILAVILVTVIGLFAPRMMANAFKHEEPDPAEICTATFPNCLNFPYPVIFAYVGTEGLGAASIFLIGILVTRNSVGMWVSGVPFRKEALKEMLLFPPILGVGSGLICRVSLNPGAIATIGDNVVSDVIMQAGIFASLMTVGFHLKRPSSRYKLPIARVTLTRLLVCSIVACLLVIPLGISRLTAVPAIVQMMAPPAVMNGLYAERFELDTELTTQVIVATTLIALILLPFELLALELLFSG